MNSITMILIEYKLDIPLDVVIFMNDWIKYEKLNDENIKEAVNLWCKNKEKCQFKYNHISSWNTSQVTNISELFQWKGDFNEDISNWNVRNVTDMSCMFYQATSFNSHISNWNVSNVMDMSGLFCGASSFSRDISGWNVSDVEDMSRMFYCARLFNSDLNNWNISNVRNMSYMLKGATSFNRNNIKKWDLTNVVEKKNVFL